MRVVEHWHRLPRESVDASGNVHAEVGQGSEQPYLLRDVPAHCRGLDYMTFFKVFPNLNQSRILFYKILFYKVHAGPSCLQVLRWVGAGEILTSHTAVCALMVQDRLWDQLSVVARVPALHRDILANWAQFPRSNFVIVARTMPGGEQGLPCVMPPVSLISYIGLNCCLPPKHP